MECRVCWTIRKGGFLIARTRKPPLIHRLPNKRRHRGYVCVAGSRQLSSGNLCLAIPAMEK